MCSATQSCPTICSPTNCHLPSSSVHGISRQDSWSGLPFPTPTDLPRPGIEPASPALLGRFFTPEPPGKPVLVIASIICNILLFSFRELWGKGQARDPVNLEEDMGLSEDLGLL